MISDSGPIGLGLGMLVLMWDLGGGSQHGRGRVLRAEEVEVDVGEADVVPHLSDARLHI